MDLLPSSEHEQIVAATADFLRSELPLARFHRHDRPPHEIDAALWQRLADQGWLGLAIAESQGGVGYSIVEEALVFVELGRLLAPTAVLTACIGAKAAASTGQLSLAADIVSGRARVAIGLGHRVAPEPAGLTGDWHIFDAAGAAYCLLLTDSGVLLTDIRGTQLQPLPCLDKSIALGKATLDRADVVARATDPSVRRAGTLLVTATMVGMAEATRDMIVEYAKVRETFGRAIGTYQAVRHPCADMAVRCEEAKAQLYYAAVSLREQTADVELQVSAARVLAQNAALKNADSCIQLHGGIGVTDEYDPHLFLKRAHVLKHWFDPAKDHLRRILAAPLAAI
ncbi:MAG: acyl-CoA dehydrogenase family protein [Steroidobacteraceae bacterium]